MDYHIDATNKILGRLSSEVAVLLRGKNTSQFDPSKLPIHTVTVYNTNFLKVTGKKFKEKVYLRHTGFAGGQRAETLEELMARDSRLVLRRAVMGMLPKNRLRSEIIKHLILMKKDVRAYSTSPYSATIP